MESELKNEIRKLYRDSKRLYALCQKVAQKNEIDIEKASELVSYTITHLLYKDDEGSLEPIRDIEAYIIRTVRNKFIDNAKIRKSKKRYKKAYNAYVQSNDSHIELDPFEEEIHAKETFEEAKHYILSNIEEFVPDKINRYILISFALEEKTYKEIHESLAKQGTEITITTLRKRYSRSLDKIRQKISNKYPGVI